MSRRSLRTLCGMDQFLAQRSLEASRDYRLRMGGFGLTEEKWRGGSREAVSNLDSILVRRLAHPRLEFAGRVLLLTPDWMSLSH